MFYNLKITGTEYFPRRVKRKKISTIFSIDAKNFPDSRKFYSKHFLSDRPSKELDRNLAEYLPSNFLFVFPQSDRTLMKKIYPIQISRVIEILFKPRGSKLFEGGVKRGGSKSHCSPMLGKQEQEKKRKKFRSISIVNGRFSIPLVGTKGGNKY